MNTRIVGVSGLFKGSVLSIGELEVTFGSDQYCDVWLVDDDQADEEQCVIGLEEGAAVIVNVSEKFDVLVNGEPVSESELRHGDAITMGSSTFMYCDNDQPDPLPFYRNPRFDRVQTVFPNTEDIQKHIVESIFRNTQAQQIAFLILDRKGDEFLMGTYCERGKPFEKPFPLDRRFVEFVLNERIAIVRNDSDSVACAPMLSAGDVLGVVYAQNPERGGLSADNHRFIADMAAWYAQYLSHTHDVELIEGEHVRLSEQAPANHPMIGDSRTMRETYRRIAQVGASESTVLILGESGAGKELGARAVHDNSPRSKRPFLPVNCAAVMSSLFESEVFGHEKGAFTGAFSQRKGYIEAAEGGTLFLDEIGELNLAAQAALLRFLQDKTYQRVGGTRLMTADVRIIAATNVDLEKAIAEGKFRADLFYRIKVVAISMPALRSRPEDIPSLAMHFLRKSGAARGVLGIHPDAHDLLAAYSWPGNVRELQNVIEHAAVFAKANIIRVQDLPPEIRDAETPQAEPSEPPTIEKTQPLREGRDTNDRERVLNALQESGWKHGKAAEVLGIHPTHLYRLRQKWGLKGPGKSRGAS